MKKKDDDFSSEIKKLKVYMTIMAIIIVVLGVYVIAGAVRFSGLNGNIGGKAIAGATTSATDTITCSGGSGHNCLNFKRDASTNGYGVGSTYSLKDSTNNWMMYSAIYGAIENPTNKDGYLAFHTSKGGVLGEKVRITSDGNVGIGINNPQYKLDVNGAINSASGIYGHSLFTTGDISSGHCLYTTKSILCDNSFRVGLPTQVPNFDYYVCIDDNGNFFKSDTPCV